MRCFLAFFALLVVTTAGASAMPALVPAPNAISECTGGPVRLDRALRYDAVLDVGGMEGGFEIVRERWRALGIPAPIPTRGGPFDITARFVSGAPGGYTIATGAGVVDIRSQSGEAQFDALATLAQLPERRGGHWVLPCVAIADAPALRWRIVSDDISRGPFPTMRYFKERIRTLASFKINGYSPYMENVVSTPAHPTFAFPEHLSLDDLHELSTYARRFHMTLIPEQQTFAHMHELLTWERFAPLAELPHGYLISPTDPATYAVLDPLVASELTAVAPVPLFHIGADEPLDLGRGRSPRTAAVFAGHVSHMAGVTARGGARAMIWDDAIQQDPSILTLIPKQTVVVTFHYGAEKSFAHYINVVDRAGFDQLVSPGANNWNEIYADLTTAYANEAQFLADAKAANSAHVLGMFETVWHDDGESLFEATWSPVIFAAASAWQTNPVDRASWHATFARAFFGSDDARYGADLDALAADRDALRIGPDSDSPNYLFWSDPFDSRVQTRMQGADLAGMRLRAEDVIAHLDSAAPPLHADAARVMQLAALRYDSLARRLQIGKEAHDDYADALANIATPGRVYRDLNIAKYLCWELRDELTAIGPRYAAAWDAESRPAGRDRVMVRYAAGAQAAMAYADRLNAVQREDFYRNHTLPPFEQAMGLMH